MCCPMDRALIQGIKRLRVLTPYDYENMDELVQDLTSALEESSSSAQHCHPSQRKWCSKKALLPLDPARLPGSVSSSTTCQTTRSAISGDDSESSLEGRALSGMLDAVQSDSDDLLQRLCAWRHRQANAAESDSLNENCLPTTARPQRRKRKLKRMAVDLEPPSGDSSQGLPDISKPVALSQPKGSTAEGSQQLCGPPAVRAGASSLCGKRKRSMRERSLESVGHRRSSECCDDMELEESKPHHGEASSSSLSSSESDAGILTNDEGREGDDEQSDFFHEGGPSCWWDELHGELDARFQAILAGSLKHLSPAARQAYHNNAKGGRAIRSGRRRLAKSVVSISLPTTSSHRSVEFLSKSENWPGSVSSERVSRTCLAEVKRRRRTPPTGPIVPGLVGSRAAPVGESSVGHQLLRRLGWEPGRGLGPVGAGVLLPVPAHVRPRGRPGLGFAPPPPPPPPSPQPMAPQTTGAEGTSFSS
ncbi:G patch domain-containing protein 2 isoform X2 [Rhipicephalus microplus]|uniref:G patch domain-containing protein 2 isoform X2 n=1 Tax=Rhipicephalus microplus TaxID=6941 RepID=UPI003F6ABF6B